ncbi:hypothetical protein [Campylobacter blaseri]|uniref:hypothetical protein n=1 Tax=Campylobacter blaseri TaxID=2042961 RepID=UPI002409C8CD|nr:hypothetical protein [Campylobacter blaseri]
MDSIRDFMRGDMTKDKDVIPVLENLKSLRSKGATVIFLHHQTKQKMEKMIKHIKVQLHLKIVLMKLIFWKIKQQVIIIFCIISF